MEQFDTLSVARKVHKARKSSAGEPSRRAAIDQGHHSGRISRPADGIGRKRRTDRRQLGTIHQGQAGPSPSAWLSIDGPGGIWRDRNSTRVASAASANPVPGNAGQAVVPAQAGLTSGDVFNVALDCAPNCGTLGGTGIRGGSKP